MSQQAPSPDALQRQIDAIDDELLEQLERRAQLAREIAKSVPGNGPTTFDPEDERQVFERLEQLALARPGMIFPRAAIRSVFREVVSACLPIAEAQSVAYMGPPGTFSHIAARTAFGLATRYIETSTIEGVIDSVARGSASFGVVPIENSTEGGVTATLDALIDTDVTIQRELVIAVAQCLIGRQEDLNQIRRVHSHPQPLAQCRLWLARHLPHAELVASTSTAAAAREAAIDVTASAIGSRLSAEIYDLVVIREGVQDRPENATRFVVLGRTEVTPTGRDKTSLVFSTEHVRGALRRALEIFDDEGLNLTRIESRPAPGRRWEYVFFTDVEGHRADLGVSRAIDRLRMSCSTVRVLGSYPRAD